MKNLLSLLAVTLIAFTSCKKNDDVPAESVMILPQKVVSLKDGITTTQTNTYDGSKILTSTSFDGILTKKIAYTYTGDLITKTETTSSDTLKNTINYLYENNVLKTLTQMVMVNSGGIKNYRTDYLYNTDGSYTYKRFAIDTVTAAELLITSGTLNYQNNNLVKKEVITYDATGTVKQTVTTNFTYDDKNSSNKNIIGISYLLDRNTSINNILSINEITLNADGTSETMLSTFQDTFDANNFPVERKRLNADGTTFSTAQIYY